MREFRTYGSVRGVPGNRHPYRDHAPDVPGRNRAFFVDLFFPIFLRIAFHSGHVTVPQNRSEERTSFFIVSG
jgi:hypothetical protein